MNISKMQVNLKKEEIIQDLLRNGILPSSYEVTNTLNEFFETNLPGLPYYKPLTVESHETSNSNAYNKMFKELGIDLDIIYKSNLEQSKKILRTEEYYQAEKELVDAEISKLQLRLNNVQDALKSGLVTQNHCQIFNNFYNIEFNGDQERNIPYTNAFVDLMQNKVYSYKTSYAFNKLDISDAAISVNTVSPYVSSVDNGNTSVILKDTSNEFYTYIINSADDKGIKVEICLTLPDISNFSSLSTLFTSSKDVTGSLSISSDGINYTDLYSVTGTSSLEWSFSSTPIKYIKLLLSKDEADGFENNLFQYYFIIKNISVADETFEGNSKYVSKPIKFDKLINTVTLKANDMMFPNTQIYYYVGVDNERNKIEWQAIENNTPFKLNLLNHYDKIITLKGYTAPADDYLHRICKLPSNVNINSISLTPGYQMWYLETIKVSTNQFDLSEFEYDKTLVESSTLIDNDVYDISVRPGKVYMMTQYIYCEKDTLVLDKWIKAENNAAIKSTMIINGNEIKGNDSAYSFRLKAGRNKVVILAYLPPNNTSIVKVSHNINLKEYSFDTYSDPILTLTSYHTLKYKIENEDRKYFAIDSENYLVVKHNPTLNVLSNVRYMVKYDCLKANSQKLVTDENGTISVGLRIMAILVSNNEDISPQILNYRLIGQ